jgi:hypothetical protein
MTAPVCEWPVIYPTDCTVLGVVEDPLVFEQIAIDFLTNWTNGVYGQCPVKIRPCRADCGGDDTFWGFGPYTSGSSMPRRGRWGPALIGGAWFNLSCGTCGDDCSCGSGAPSLRLPGPVSSVEEVLIDGLVLPTDAYRVDNHSLLVRVDGNGWPTCQNMAADPATDENTWEISYTKGYPVPVGGQVAAGALACELAKGATGDRSCMLPQRIQTIARQGVTVTMLDTFDDIAAGRTGVWMVDSWIASVTKPPRGGSVYSVDIPRPRHRTTTWP